MAINIAGQTIAGNAPHTDTPRAKNGRISFNATAIVAADETLVNLGFTPTYLVWENVTDRIRNEWYEGMAANSAINTLATGVRTLSVTGTTGGFVVCDSDGSPNVTGRSFKILQNATLGAVLASKDCNWRAIG